MTPQCVMVRLPQDRLDLAASAVGTPSVLARGLGLPAAEADPLVFGPAPDDDPDGDEADRPC